MVQLKRRSSNSLTIGVKIDDGAVQTNDLKVARGKNGYFEIDASRRVTKKIKRRVSDGLPLEDGRNAHLYILFLVNKKPRTVDYEQLQSIV